MADQLPFSAARAAPDSDLTGRNKIANAKHNILAYRIGSDKFKIIEGFDSDGEKRGAEPVMHLLRVLDLTNVAVVVTRWYGGIFLRSDRYKCIRTAAQHALIAGGFIKE
ncbi:hypothetical protein D910_04410 [Dendroctonus ponderosae]|uniref:Impact N-terminal domain-containing protein n=1 Tax=Dendroctonus ponderosae TaxID=77166 RepID=U4U3V4_DENPD|nr:hypothetical protein D910_04410 [Dendroctonus ponderosae]